MLTMEQINDILCEELADDLPVAEHMMLWTADDIRKYAQEGGFWSPGAGSGDSVTDAELSRAATQISLDGGPPLGWEDYEQHAIPLDSPGGAALAAAMDDWWAVRCSELMGCFEPQAEGSWCGIASLAIVLRMLRPAGEVPSQYSIFKGFVQGRDLVPEQRGSTMRHGLSMRQEQALLQTVLGKMALPHVVAREHGALEARGDAKAFRQVPP